jgi:outer membrane lipoprotein SlyB
MRYPNILIAGLLAVSLSGCAAATVAISKAELDVQTKMSNTVFLDPVPPADRTVFVQIRNTSDKPDFDIASDVRSAVAAKGYVVTDDPDAAHYLLQANVLQAGKTDPTAAERALAGGYGDTAVGALAGAAVGYQVGNSSGGGALAGGLIGTAMTTVANAVVRDVTYAIITDLQISERARAGVMVREDSQQTLRQGTSGSKSVQSSEITDWKRYQTRIVSTANKVNLEFEEAAPQLVTGLVRSISGIL